jgi:2',3'-cyclic-nucleotide 2'-phosphodiesterase (5'-nucleotidase family)
MEASVLTILQINDVHGYLEPHEELFWEAGRITYRRAGGYPRIRTYFERVRRERAGAVLAFDCGDTLHGTYPAVASRGDALVEPLNLLGLDGWTGHWDFAYGPDRLRDVARRLHHPFLAANCFHTDTGRLAFAPSVTIDRAGIRVGVIGLAATIVDKTMPPHFSQGLRFTLGREELPEHIRRLREHEGADLVVVLSHLGFPQDCQLAADVQGVDVLLSGHTHNRLTEPAIVGGTVIVQSGSHGSFVGRLDLAIAGGATRVVAHQLVPMDESIEPDAEMTAAVDRILAPHRAMLAEVVGHTATPLDRATMLESTMDNLLLQAIAEAAGTHLAFSNGWRYGAPVPPGPVTMNDLWNMVPPNPPVSVVELTGVELQEMLEENLEHTFARDPYRQMGGYMKRCWGITMHVKLENPAGRRIQHLTVGDEEIDPERPYTAAFVTTQGVPARYGRARRDLDVHAIDALRRCLRHRSPAEAGLRGTVRLV